MPQKLKITTATDPPGHPDLWRIEAENWCLEPVNTKTASKVRRAELDSELQAMGAIVIRVESLGAAMEAYEEGNRCNTFTRATNDPGALFAYEAGYRNALNRGPYPRMAAYLTPSAILGDES